MRRLAHLWVLALMILAVVAAPSSGTFGGQDGRISFRAFVPKTRSLEIFTANSNGGDVKPLTSNPRFASVISDWSPDGQRIAFDSDRPDLEGNPGAVQIYVINADGGGLTQLTRGPGFHGYPGWSPDGGSIAIASDWGGGPALEGIWIIPAADPDGVTQADALRLTTTPAGSSRPKRRWQTFPGGGGADSEPQFSPDGNAILFTRFRSDRRSAIHRVNLDGSGLSRLTPWRINASDPDWSPDGQRITFDSGDFGGPGSKGDIYVMRSDGSGRKRLTNTPRLRKGAPFVLANNPVWSPSGTRIMFTQFMPTKSILVAARPNGSGKHVVVGRGFNDKVDWGTHP